MLQMLGQLIPALMRGARVTLELTLAAAALGLVMAFVVGIGRLINNPIVQWTTGAYVQIFRGTSALVQLFWLFFVLPFFGVSLTPFMAGVLALGLNMGAYGAENVRGAIQAIPHAQIEATVALNLSWWQRLRFVILPQALVRMLPTFGNQITELIKMTALVSLVTLQDLTYYGFLFTQTKGNTALAYTALLLVYFALSYPFTLFVGWAERRTRWAGYGEAAK
jgi:polar amino acid transport system permease protein